MTLNGALKSNGAAALNTPPQSVQVNPAELARAMLAFLDRVAFTRAERATFDMCEALLQALANGSIAVTEAPRESPPAPTIDPPPGIAGE